MRYKALGVLSCALILTIFSACGGGDSLGDYVEELTPLMSSLEQSLQIVEDALNSNVTEATRLINDEVSEDQARLVLLNSSVVLIREAIVQDKIIAQLIEVSPPHEADRYHELLLEYAGLRRDSARLMGESIINNDSKAMVEAADVTVRADLKNKEVVEEGQSLFGDR